MSRKQFEDDCPDCRPVILDMITMRPLPENHPAMVRILHIWRSSPREQREAFHRVTCLNSRDPEDLEVMREWQQRLQATMQ